MMVFVVSHERATFRKAPTGQVHPNRWAHMALSREEGSAG
jgi:hypothetical protein